MPPASRTAAAVLLIVCGVGNAHAAVPTKLAELAVSTLGAVKHLRRSGERAVIAIVVREGSAESGKELGHQMELDRAQQLGPVSTVVQTVYGSSGDGARLADLHRKTPLAAVVLLDPPHASIRAIISFATQNQVLTISSRPQDAGVTGFVIFEGIVYRYQPQLDSEKIDVEKFLATSVDGQRFVQGGPYERAIRSMEKPGVKPDWGLVIVQLRLSMAAADAPAVGSQVPFKGGRSEFFLPHVNLAKALFRFGDCDGAEDQLTMSSATHEDAPSLRSEAESERPRCPHAQT